MKKILCSLVSGFVFLFAGQVFAQCKEIIIVNQTDGDLHYKVKGSSEECGKPVSNSLAAHSRQKISISTSNSISFNHSQSGRTHIASTSIGSASTIICNRSAIRGLVCKAQ